MSTTTFELQRAKEDRAFMRRCALRWRSYGNRTMIVDWIKIAKELRDSALRWEGRR